LIKPVLLLLLPCLAVLNMTTAVAPLPLLLIML
jgi:hypothetical protein